MLESNRSCLLGEGGKIFLLDVKHEYKFVVLSSSALLFDLLL
jgi:hypothetical protein